MTIKEKAEIVKSELSIPDYFNAIVKPNMAGYYSGDDTSFMSVPRVKCCLHSEKTASMTYYEETNSYFCYGCRSGGDVINLHREFLAKQLDENATFRDAVEFLYNYFLEGKTQTSITKKPLIQPKSTAIEIARFNRYTNNLEAELLADASWTDDLKKELWRIMDEISILVDIQKLNAVEALKALKEEESIRRKMKNGTTTN